MKVSIYGLSGTLRTNIFYVGITRGELNVRLTAHIVSAEGGQDVNKDKCEMIKKLGESVEIFEITSFDMAEGRDAHLFRIEKRWIYKLMKRGIKLTNNCYAAKKIRKTGKYPFMGWEMLIMESKVIRQKVIK